MIAVINQDNVIINIIDQEIPTANNQRLLYPWLKLWDVYNAKEPLHYMRERYVKATGVEFSSRRDAIRWIDIGGVTYGFDSAVDDITNFMAAFTPLLVDKIGTVYYKVWLNATDKSVVELNYEEMLAAYNEVRRSQLEAYAWYEEIKSKLLAAKDQEELEGIFPLGGQDYGNQS